MKKKYHAVILAFLLRLSEMPEPLFREVARRAQAVSHVQEVG